MIFIYNIGIRLYYLAILIASLWNEKARKWIQGRRGQQNLFSVSAQKNIWFHCASVGEFEQALPLLSLCCTLYPESPILTTFYSPSGYEYALKKYPDLRIAFLPLDTPSAMQDFIVRVNPKMVFIIKYEFWYHLLKQLHRQKIPLFLVAGIFRKDQLFFNGILGAFPRKMLHFFSHIFVQNEQSKILLNGIGVQQVSVAGDTRFDRVAENKQADFVDPSIEQFVSTDTIFVAGSVWNSDIPVLKRILSSLPADWKVLIAPHEVGHFDTTWIAEPISSYQNPGDGSARIFLLDIVGILSKVYRYANFVYVGGGFGKGIHNILEPAIYLKPVLIGPNFAKFQEAVELVAAGCAFVVNTENIDFLIKNELFDKIKREQLEIKMNAYMSANTNLSEKIMVYVSRYLDK
ncbi:MAG: hypothetical protein IPK62_16180 [Bacteroidetes bacterium]|nr:hypothetical protein [Bacteroidota bacterium]